MRTFILAAIILLPSLLPVTGFAAADTNIVKLDQGQLSGTVQDGVRVFLGIPYAAAPVGELRWRPPQKAALWTQVKSAEVFGPACPQPKQTEGGNFSEDCLYLNVWTPAKNSGEQLPVMVWIHGGAFNFGSASLPEYNGQRLAEKGVVVVTLNYRLGPLGFLAHPDLAKESAHGVSGNYGLLDQVAALEWVRDNISAFGGNPGQVTIFGQSAGSRSVSLQMISPLSTGLFHRAIAESGGPLIGSEYLSSNFNGDMTNALRMGKDLSSRLGCDKDAEPLVCMRAKSAQEVVAAAACNTSVFDDGGLFFAPVFDSWALPANPLSAYSSGRQHAVPFITGSTLNEGNIYIADEPDLSLAKYKSYLRSRFGDEAQKAFALFPAQGDRDAAVALDKLLTVGANAAPARISARSMAQVKTKSYLFQFTRRPDTALARKLGVHHGVDIAYVFGHTDKSAGYDDTDRQLSRTVMSYWVNFAKTGNPNGTGLPVWPEYDAVSAINMEFSDSVHTNKSLFKDECDFIDMHSQYRSKE